MISMFGHLLARLKKNKLLHTMRSLDVYGRRPKRIEFVCLYIQIPGHQFVVTFY